MEAYELANHLGNIRDQIAKLEVEKKQVEEALIYQMKMNGLKNVRTDYGETISRAYRSGYKVTDKVLALKWAEAKKVTKVEIDMKKAAIVFKHSKKLPAGFEETEIEYLRMLKPSDDPSTSNIDGAID